MALATKCPHCNTIFRVASDQLKIRGGIVRCGACNNVFDGNAALLNARAPRPPLPEPPAIFGPAELETPEQETNDAASVTEAREQALPDSDSLHDPFAPLLEAAATGDAAEPAPEPEFTAEVDVARDVNPVPFIETAPEPEPEPGPGPGPQFLPALAAFPEQGELQVATEIDEPGFVKQGRRRQRTGKTMRSWMGIGCAVLLLALLVQGASTFRNQVAAQVPQLKPALAAMCARFGCRIELPAQIKFVTVEQGELQTLSENTFSFATVLRNQSGSAQAWPNLELILNDASDKPLLRRVFVPRDYLNAPADPAAGFAPRSEQAVKLYFKLDQLKASGYHIAVFYP